MKKGHLIYGIHVQDRARDAVKLQGLLTEYGCNIKTRVGLHEVDENACAAGGVLLLEMVGDPARCAELKQKVAGIKGIDFKEMTFEHE